MSENATETVNTESDNNTEAQQTGPATPFTSLPPFMQDAINEINAIAEQHNKDIATYKAQRAGAKDDVILSAAKTSTDEDVRAEWDKLTRLTEALKAQRDAVLELQKSKMQLGMSDEDVTKLKAQFQESGKTYKAATDSFKSQGPLVAGMLKALGLPEDLDLMEYITPLDSIRGIGGGTSGGSTSSGDSIRIHGIGVIQLHEGDEEYPVGRKVKDSKGNDVTKYNFTFLAQKLKSLTQVAVDTKDLQNAYFSSQGKTAETRDEMRDGSFEYKVTDAKGNERTFSVTVTRSDV